MSGDCFFYKYRNNRQNNDNQPIKLIYKYQQMTKTLFLLIFLTTSAKGQSIDKDRIIHTKMSVVRILINDEAAGTGFFIRNDGYLLTCWHVIQSAFLLDSSKNILGIKNIKIEYASGLKKEAGIIPILLSDGRKLKDASVYDYCILKLTDTSSRNEYLELGGFRTIDEGEGVYTCGYPLGIKQQFVSTGILSTKYTDTIQIIENGTTIKIPRKQALIDLTMNRGNSGGPIIKIGKTLSQDTVIGIADFIISSGSGLEPLFELVKNTKDMGLADVNPDKKSGLNLKYALQILTGSAMRSTNGVSGCISLDYFNSIWKVTEQ
jgi:serine protease Do